ncbi:MAG: LamG domain-containing protein [Planctomycetota bacterium]|jgi:hypothetical protein
MCKKLILLTSFVLVLGMVLTSVAKADLLAHWKFDDGAGNRIEDSSGNGHHGTIAGTPAWVLGPDSFGGALDFHNTVGAEIPNFDPTGGTGSFSLAFWCNWDGTGNIQHYFTKSNGWNISTMMFQVENKGLQLGDPARDRRLHLACHSFGQAILHVIPDNEWSHHTLIYDGVAGTATGYLNGVDIEGPKPTGIGQDLDSTILIGVAQPLNRIFQGSIDDMQLYSGVLSQAEIQAIMLGVPPGAASDPSPEDEATDVPRDVVLSWTPGEFAPSVNGHKVYLGENFNDVNDGIGGIAQDANSYAPPQRLDFGTTYYWRIDEVNGAPDYAVHEGSVWSFTTEPFAYAIENITATASSSAVAKGPENTINGSGLDDSGLLHGKDGDDYMWLSDIAGPQPTWIEFEFDEVYKLHELWVWNSNEFLEPMIGFGFKDVTIEYSVNGTDYTTLGTTTEFARAPGTPDYAHNTTVDFGGVGAKYVRLTANSNWGGILAQYGLSEVRFFYIPVYAREPNPDSGATDVSIGTIDAPADVTLGFRAGREAASHDVYFSTDQQAVLDGTVAATTVTETSYGPLSLDLGKTYYWRVDEVNEAETPATWQGKLWNFTTQEYFVVDDFESYNDLDPTDPNSNRIFNAWIDGYEQPTNGSIVGYAVPPFTEQTIVHGDKQSMPLAYDNSGTARYSEATLTLTSGHDWTVRGAGALSLWFKGNPAGFVEEPAGTYTMTAAGADIWGTSDEFRYAWKQLSGDGEITATVESVLWVTGSNDWTKAGVMIRETLDASSKNAFVALTTGSGNGATFQWRPIAGGSSISNRTLTGISPPSAIRLVRQGNTFTGYVFQSGQWQQEGQSATVAMTDPVYIGMALTSHSSGVTTEAVFSDVQTTGAVTGVFTEQAIGVDMPANTPESMYVAVASSGGTPVVVRHDDPRAAQAGDWTEWAIDLKQFSDGGVNLTNVNTISIGFGDKANPQPGGSGIMLFDDISLYPLP